ncbi:EpsG family protein [Psychrobacillus sp. L4]|uniref:EpsG family protein n=1 Tax=Psychrobacillus sp. L4 TaxID=3236892 RepID=UPI0036F2EE48
MYYTVLLIGFIFQLFNKKILFWIFSIILVLLAVLRYGIGLDFFAYEYLYLRLNPSILDEIRFGLDNQEAGFRALGSIMKNIGLSYQQYLGAYSIITILYMSKICNKYSNNPTLSLLLFFCFYYLTWTFSGIRQGATIAIGLFYLLECIEKNKTIKFVFIVILLSFIHSSAIVLLLLYFLSRIDIDKNKLIKLSVASITLSLIPSGFIISKLTWLPFYSRIFPYLNTEITLNLFDFAGICRILFLIVALTYYDQYCKQSDISKKIINMYILSFIMYFLLQFSELTAARLGIYGKFLDIIILANILYLYKLSINRLIYILGILFLCFMYLSKESAEIKKVIITDSLITPYVNVFNKGTYNFSRFNIFIDD